MRSQIRLKGLRARIISWFFAPTLAILVVVALLTFCAYERVTEDLVIERNQELTCLLSEQLATRLTQHADLLQAFISSHPELYRYDLAARQATLRQDIGRLMAFDGGVLLLDHAGTVVAADRYPLNVLGQDWSDRAYVRQMLDAPGLTFSNIEPDGPEGAESIVVAMPATDAEGHFAGMVMGMFRLDTKMSALYRSILELRLYGGDNAAGRLVYLVDRNGRAIYHSDVQRIGEDVSAQVPVQQALSGEVGAFRTHNLEGQEIVASFAPLPGLNWGLVIEESWAALTRTSQGYRQLLLVLLALGVGVPALAVAFGMRRVTRPIAALTSAAQEVAGGNLSQTIAVNTGDELGALAEQFNRMSAQLQESYAHLEQRVADRTRELATLNAITAVVSRSLDLEEILRDALDETMEALGVEAGGAFCLDEDRRTLTLAARRGLPEDPARQVTRLPLKDSLAGRAAGVERPIVVPVSDYPTGALKDLLQAAELQMVISVPLVTKGRMVGIIDLATRIQRPVRPEELSLLAAIGQQTGVAVENARLYEQAEQHAASAERSRLARDLHDAVTQTLFSASLIAEVLPRLWERNPEQGRQRLQELHELNRGALAEMRTLLLELRPAALEEAELGDLLRQLGESVTGRARMPVTVQLEGKCTPPLEVKVALYRITQEALNNVVKHAEAGQAWVSLRCTSSPTGEEPGVELRIRDDGRGFDPASIPLDHLGVGIMRERAATVGATLEIESQAGHGMQIVIVWKGERHLLVS